MWGRMGCKGRALLPRPVRRERYLAIVKRMLHSLFPGAYMR